MCLEGMNWERDMHSAHAVSENVQIEHIYTYVEKQALVLIMNTNPTLGPPIQCALPLGTLTAFGVHAIPNISCILYLFAAQLQKYNTYKNTV